MSAVETDINFQAPIKSVSIENMVRQRAAVLERIEQALQLLREAQGIAQSGHLGMPRIDIQGSGRRGVWGSITDDRAREMIRREIDCEAWSYLMRESGLLTFMDATARREWSEQLYSGENVPEFTQENIEETFKALFAARIDMFERGVINCFRRLSWDYKTNQPFVFGKRIIVERLVTHAGTGPGRVAYMSHDRTNELDDLLRVFHLLDGKPEPDHRQGMYFQLSRASESGNEWEGEYIHVRWFKKGSGHITFKRPDLVDRMNEIIARHFPGVLPDGRRGRDAR